MKKVETIEVSINHNPMFIYTRTTVGPYQQVKKPNGMKFNYVIN